MHRSMEEIAAEWIRAVRGRRPQAIVSQRLGYKSNVVYRWESGACLPSAPAALRMFQICGGNVAASLKTFLAGSSEWMANVDLTSVAGVSRLLGELRGKTAIQELASATSISRFSISRWLSGRCAPTLPEFFALVDKSSLRFLDFINCFVSPARLPSLSLAWHQLVESRRAAYEHPWSHAVLRVLELRDYAALTTHVPGWIARRLNIEENVERESLALLESCGQIIWNGTHFAPCNTGLVDTRPDPRRARELKAWWAQIALQRLRCGAPGLYAYNLCALAKEDLDRIELLQRKYFRQMSQIIANSTGSDHVVLYGAHLLRLDE
jgi:uncharacterized protein DUF4423